MTEPTPVDGPTALPEVPAARERVLEALASHGMDGAPAASAGEGSATARGWQEPLRPATIGDLVDVLGGHPNTTRAHLARLVDNGLVMRTALEAGTRGRPALGHQLTDRGRLVLESLRVARPVATDELVTAMAEHLETTTDPDVHARAIGRRWAAQLTEAPSGSQSPGRRAQGSGGPARRDPTPVETVVGLLTTAGFSPQLAPDGGIELRTCPVLASARAHPGVVCTMHEEMLRSALDRAGDGGVGLRLVPFARPGACLVELGPDRR
ncbi:helix-turn-helix transcriptional regulator [Humibacillus xanthopallidus]|uniref:helix-turn-helix transcriptional regulator n=1 Tax=Humibacillus xanthopallidus TaxID=412689 RepID=UPI00384CF194